MEGLPRRDTISPRKTAQVRSVRTQEELQRFERILMPHLAASYNLARWLTRNDHDAEDIVQEAYLRAVRSFDRYRGGDPRSWVLTIVRNTCYTWLRQRRGETAFAGGADDDEVAEIPANPDSQPEVQLLRDVDRQLLRDALEA